MIRARLWSWTALGALVAAITALFAAGSPLAARAQSQATPAATSAVAISQTRVRVRFASSLGADPSVSDFSLTMGARGATVTEVVVAPDRRSVEIEASPAWPNGTAGTVRFAGGEPVRVWAAPGDITAPVLSGVRLAHSTICVKGLSRSCSVSGGTVSYTVDEPVTMVLDLRSAGSNAPSLLKVGRRAGKGRVSFNEKIEGRRLRPGSYRLHVWAVDAAGNESRRFTLRLRVRP
jgi:hypothetical protein